jgi:hypothetical protein
MYIAHAQASHSDSLHIKVSSHPHWDKGGLQAANLLARGLGDLPHFF